MYNGANGAQLWFTNAICFVLTDNNKRNKNIFIKSSLVHGCPIVQWRHLVGTIVLDLMWRHTWKTIKKHQKISLTTKLFSGHPTPAKLHSIYYNYNKPIFVLVRISIFLKTQMQTTTCDVSRSLWHYTVDGRSVVLITQWNVVTNFNYVHFLFSRLSSKLCCVILLL